MAQCRATCKATGQQCRRRAVRGRAVCTVHGGLTPIGAAHPRATKGGRYSRHLTERLASRFAEGLIELEADSLRDELALVDARIADLLRLLGTGESRAAWRALRRAMSACDRKVARGANRAVAEAEAVARMAAIVAEAERPGGPGERDSWSDVMAWVELRRRLALTESARAKQAREVITPERMMVVLGAILAVIRVVVTDRETLARISAGFLAVVGGPGSGEIPATSSGTRCCDELPRGRRVLP